MLTLQTTLVKRWNIDKDIIVVAVIDNARNMVNAINGLCLLNLDQTLQYRASKMVLAHISNVVSHFHRSSKVTYSLKLN